MVIEVLYILNAQAVRRLRISQLEHRLPRIKADKRRSQGIPGVEIRGRQRRDGVEVAEGLA
jgi:hypothetical protein